MSQKITLSNHVSLACNRNIFIGGSIQVHLILVKPDHFGYLSILLATSTALCGNTNIFDIIAPMFFNGLF